MPPPVTPAPILGPRVPPTLLSLPPTAPPVDDKLDDTSSSSPANTAAVVLVVLVMLALMGFAWVRRYRCRCMNSLLPGRLKLPTESSDELNVAGDEMVGQQQTFREQAGLWWSRKQRHLPSSFAADQTPTCIAAAVDVALEMPVVDDGAVGSFSAASRPDPSLSFAPAPAADSVARQGYRFTALGGGPPSTAKEVDANSAHKLATLKQAPAMRQASSTASAEPEVLQLSDDRGVVARHAQVSTLPGDGASLSTEGRTQVATVPWTIGGDEAVGLTAEERRKLELLWEAHGVSNSPSPRTRTGASAPSAPAIEMAAMPSPAQPQQLSGETAATAAASARLASESALRRARAERVARAARCQSAATNSSVHVDAEMGPADGTVTVMEVTEEVGAHSRTPPVGDPIAAGVHEASLDDKDAAAVTDEHSREREVRSATDFKPRNQREMRV